VIFWLASGLAGGLGSPTALAAAWPLRNVTSGLGLSLYDYSASLGLPGRVQTVLTMNGLHKYPDDPADGGGSNHVAQDVLAHGSAIGGSPTLWWTRRSPPPTCSAAPTSTGASSSTRTAR
jgi:hypothetical protein